MFEGFQGPHDTGICQSSYKFFYVIYMLYMCNIYSGIAGSSLYIIPSFNCRILTSHKTLHMKGGTQKEIPYLKLPLILRPLNKIEWNWTKRNTMTKIAVDFSSTEQKIEWNWTFRTYTSLIKLPTVFHVESFFFKS